MFLTMLYKKRQNPFAAITHVNISIFSLNYSSDSSKKIRVVPPKKKKKKKKKKIAQKCNPSRGPTKHRKGLFQSKRTFSIKNDRKGPIRNRKGLYRYDITI